MIQTQVCLTLEPVLLVTVLYYILIAKILSYYQFIRSLVKQLNSVEQGANKLDHRFDLCGLVSF